MSKKTKTTEVLDYSLQHFIERPKERYEKDVDK